MSVCTFRLLLLITGRIKFSWIAVFLMDCVLETTKLCVLMWQGRWKSLSEFFYTARNATSMYFDEEPSTLDIEVRQSSSSCSGRTDISTTQLQAQSASNKNVHSVYRPLIASYTFLHWQIYRIGHGISTFWASRYFFTNLHLCHKLLYYMLACVCRLYFFILSL